MVVAFALPWIIPADFADLGVAARISLGILLLAATFWILEPIPIYATSLLVILLQIALLSAQGPLTSLTAPATAIPVEGQVTIPAEAVVQHEGRPGVWDWEGPGSYRFVPIETAAEVGDQLSVVLSEEVSAVLLEPGHWQTEFVAPSYTLFTNTLANPILILFLGGFVIAAAAVKHGLDVAMCRGLLQPFGTQPRMIVLGLMLSTAILSAFMSNTATTAMMIAVALPVVRALGPNDPFRMAVLLAIPFSANVGGILTPIGTPPNAIVLNMLTERGEGITFVAWMGFTAPLVFLLLFLTWLLLTSLHRAQTDRVVLHFEYSDDTPPTGRNLLILVFGATVLLWVTESLHGIPSGMVAFLPVALLPALGVVTTKDIRGLPWEVLWLMAGGISLGISLENTGLASWLVNLAPWGDLPGWAVIGLFGLAAILLATFIANTVAATLLAPIVGTLVGSGLTGDLSLLVAGLVIAIGSSLGMALPISTPPNAIAMSTGFLPSRAMMVAGTLVGLFGYALLLLSTFFFWRFIIS